MTLALGLLVMVFGWLIEALIDGPWATMLIIAAPVGYALTLTGVWLRYGERADEGVVIGSGKGATAITATGRFLVVSATVAALDGLGFFGGAFLAIAVDTDGFLPGIASLVLAGLGLFIAVVLGAAGITGLLLARLLAKRAPAEAEPVDPSVPYAPGGAPVLVAADEPLDGTTPAFARPVRVVATGRSETAAPWPAAAGTSTRGRPSADAAP